MLTAAMLIALLFFPGRIFAQSRQEKDREVQRIVSDMMKEGNIPGLSIVIINGTEQIIKSFGYADKEKEKPVTPSTLFELGSCTKAFTSLAAMLLVERGQLDIDKSVKFYIPWFKPTYKKKPVVVTVRQLLHHTSGIPWSTISKIPVSQADDALEHTVMQLRDQALVDTPGRRFEYATINYDVLALIIQYVSGKPFETFITEDLIKPLGLSFTSIGSPLRDSLMATGYKIGFFKARRYQAPAFRGNNAAGYMISNATDMAKWLRLQMGIESDEMSALIKVTQQRDETVPPHDDASYGMGWEVSLRGDGELHHGGLNPNYTSYMAFRAEKKIGVVVLANSNSPFTNVIGNKILKLFAGEKMEREYNPGDGNDKMFSVVSILMACFILLVMTLAGFKVAGILNGSNKYEPLSWKKTKQIFFLLSILAPVVYGIYIMPRALYEFNWASMIIWAPVSFLTLLVLVLVALGAGFLTHCIGIFFPEKNVFKRFGPRILLLSIMSGLSNMVLVVLITSSIDSKIDVGYLIFYYFLALIIYLSARRFVQVRLIKITNDAIYDIRERIVRRIFSTSYQSFEQMDRGRVYTTLNDDAGTIGDSINMFVGLATSFFTAVGAFLYLASIASWATMLATSLILVLVALYYVVSKNTNRYFMESRDSKNVFMRLINGVIDGFKELSLHHGKRKEYMEDIFSSAQDFRVKVVAASVRFVNASILGESVLILILGSVAFAFPVFFPGIKSYTLMSFLIVLLYLIGPVNTILGSVPAAMRLRIAWKRMHEFLNDIPSSGSKVIDHLDQKIPPVVESFAVEGVSFQYKNDGVNRAFEVGPIDVEVKNGEILFIVGANGSGKSTLAKLFTGLYRPDKGRIRINGAVVDSSLLGEYFSTVYSPLHLFEKLYNIDIGSNRHRIDKYLDVLDLGHKVQLRDKSYSTINLSGGQRKRLALLQCYMENSPIFLFDEWAADQDPSYRSFFYRILLPEMKAMGKIIIAITHDDHYFDIADKVLKMEDGKLADYHPAFA